jgi:hypothetical protein
VAITATTCLLELCRFSIMAWISSVEVWVRFASARTSSATTGEAATGVPRAGRLDGRVQRQQVGLLGDAADHVEDAADVVAEFPSLWVMPTAFLRHPPVVR